MALNASYTKCGSLLENNLSNKENELKPQDLKCLNNGKNKYPLCCG